MSNIARRTGFNRKTVRRYIARGLEPPAYTPRPPRPTLLDPYRGHLLERVVAFPKLRASRLLRELRAVGYRGGYTQLTDFLRAVRPQTPVGFEQRFETAPGQQAQVDFAHFRTAFTAEPGVSRVVWLFSMVLGHSRLIWARFVAHQDLQAVLRCHAAAFEALGGLQPAPQRFAVRPKQPGDGAQRGTRRVQLGRLCEAGVPTRTRRLTAARGRVRADNSGCASLCVNAA